VRRGNEHWVLLIALSLSMLGLLMVFSSSLVVTASSPEFGSDPYFFVRRQGIYFGVGLLGLWIARSIDLERWRTFLSIPFLVLNMALLILVLLIGPEINGAQRWLMVGSFQFQPAELAKLAIVFYMADFLARRGEKVQQFTRLMPALVLFGITLLLIEREPDLGTAVVVAGVFIAMLFTSGGSMSHLLGMAGAGALVAVAAVATKPYRLRRITSFMNPEADPLGDGYHAIQSLLAIGSGGFAGRGLGAGHQKFKYLPEAHTDYIFAILGEELGMVGTMCVVLLFLALLYKGFQIALHCRRPYLRLIAIGVSFQLTMQAFINIGVVTALTPSKGIPLPFISYGGTSLVFSLIAVGLLMNVAEANVAIRDAAREPSETPQKKREGATLTSSGEDSLDAVSTGVWEEKAAGTRLTGSSERMPRPAVEPGLVKRSDWSERRRRSAGAGQDGEKRSRGGRG
jgi:cell division protein FtsW